MRRGKLRPSYFLSRRFSRSRSGLFGLGTCYFIWGGQGLFGYPKSDPNVEETVGLWGA
jgi:hypothetical protein